MSFKKIAYSGLCLIFFLFFIKAVNAAETPLYLYPTSAPAGLQIAGCDPSLNEYYASLNPSESCAGSYADWLADPETRHLWVFDPEVTEVGKSSERARQFIYWAISKKSIDNHPILLNIWKTTRNVVYFLLVLIAAIMGLGIIISKKTSFNLNIQVWPSIIKLMTLLLYVTLSAAIVISIIQLSDITMQFFVESLGGKDVFNTYFNSTSQEVNYNFKGYRDLNLKVQESIKAEIFLIKATNITYYVMGIFLILRKILLWFLLFLSPFLAILAPFVFIRNIGWIWVGVFFQWVFYGPLFALFFGALSSIWKAGIPYPFDFSRINTIAGHIYPTAINITYGGPAQINNQSINPLNNGNYVDTFTEYIISLIMLWAVMLFPWWLLRIFRDYCCDGINAMKNILLSMYDQARGHSPSKTPPSLPSSPFGATLNISKPNDTTVPIKIKLETIEDIKKTNSEDISKTLNLKYSKITDIANFETNKENREAVYRNLNYLANPTKAETPTERQKYMNIRTELFNRVVKEDQVAKQILSSISSSKIEQVEKREEIVRSIPKETPVNHLVSVKVNLSNDKITSFNSTMSSIISRNSSFINSVSQNTNIPTNQVQTILSSFSKNIAVSSPKQVVTNIVKETGIKKESVTQVLNQISQAFKSDQNIVNNIAHETNTAVTQVKKVLTMYKQSDIKQNPKQIVQTISKETGLKEDKVTTILKTTSTSYKAKEEANKIIKEIAEKENIKEEDVAKVIDTQIPLSIAPENNIEQTISIPSTISLEDYEAVKKMWIQQYEKGEVPVTENIQTREEWCDRDIVFITNTLNKLTSPDKQLVQEGLDDLGYILPIFLINNLKGEELLVYLKAKLEAAKSVKANAEKEREITERLKAGSEEEFVDVEKPKAKEAEKTMEMKKELTADETKKPDELKPEPQNVIKVDQR